MEKNEILQKVITAGIVGTLAATIRALLTKHETLMQRIRTFFAGVIMAVLLGYILRGANMSEQLKEVIIGASSAFISSIWPVLEALTLKLIKKKGDEYIGDNNHDRTHRKRNHG